MIRGVKFHLCRAATRQDYSNEVTLVNHKFVTTRCLSEGLARIYTTDASLGVDRSDYADVTRWTCHCDKVNKSTLIREQM